MHSLQYVKTVIDYIRKGKDEAFIYLLPTKRLVQEARWEILNAPGISGITKSYIWTFDELVEHIIKQDESVCEYLDDAAREPVLETVVGSLLAEGALKYIEAIADFPGLTWALAQLISEFKQAGLLPGDLEPFLRVESVGRDEANFFGRVEFESYGSGEFNPGGENGPGGDANRLSDIYTLTATGAIFWLLTF